MTDSRCFRSSPPRRMRAEWRQRCRNVALGALVTVLKRSPRVKHEYNQELAFFASPAASVSF
ncbi:hypothetical protein E2986_13090 [Frieseomelitta varia]|uniref:Uncharacterized protein n=1 Tax=Frieseomelitta varia TaxID=561572 RepID=A0A833RNZ5_9HYME|nr:hypothetical protein E2986_13090 [Frieseomelitta varia]